MIVRLLIVILVTAGVYLLFKVRSMSDITKIDVEELGIEPKERHFIQFSTSWCGPCKRVKPLLQELAKSLDIGYNQVDVEAEYDKVGKYKITSVPQIYLIDNTGTVLGHWNRLPKVSEL